MDADRLAYDQVSEPQPVPDAVELAVACAVREWLCIPLEKRPAHQLLFAVMDGSSHVME